MSDDLIARLKGPLFPWNRKTRTGILIRPEDVEPHVRLLMEAAAALAEQKAEIERLRKPHMVVIPPTVQTVAQTAQVIIDARETEITTLRDRLAAAESALRLIIERGPPAEYERIARDALVKETPSGA